MKNPRLFICAAFLCLSALHIIRAQPSGTLYWNPGQSASLDAGGSGVWESGSMWSTAGPAAHTWVSGTDSNATMSIYENFVFGGLGQTGTYTITTNLAELIIPSLDTAYTSTLTFLGDYIIKPSQPNGTTIGGSGAYIRFALVAASGKTVHFDSSEGSIMIKSDATNSSIPGISFSGGGRFVLDSNVFVNQSHRNSRVSIGSSDDPTRTILDISGSMYAARLYVDNAIINVKDGAYLDITGVTLPIASSIDRSAFQIGTAPGTAPAVINLTNATIKAVASGTSYHHRGIMFGSGASSAGGILNLNAGALLETSFIYAHNSLGATRTALLVFDGGTLATSADTFFQSQADNFIYGDGFNNTENRGVVIKSGGATIDTAGLSVSGSTNNVATVKAVIRGEGGLTKAGANTLQLSMAAAYTGITTVAGGTLRAGVANAIATSEALVIENEAAFDAAGYNQSIKTLAGAGNMALGNTAGRTLTITGTSNSSFSGAITGRGTLIRAGTGELELSGTNTYDGGTQINGGALVVAGDVSLGTAGAGIIFSGGTLAFVNPNEATFARDTTINTSGAVFDTRALSPVLWTGAIAGAGGLTKTGAGALLLHGDNSGYSSGVTVSQGSLLLADGSSSLGGIIDVTAPNARFGGSGTALGAVKIAGGAHVHAGLPGSSGVLHVGTLDLAAGALLSFEMITGGALGVSENSSLLVNTLELNGNNASQYTINISRFIAGRFDLGNISELSGASLLVDGQSLGGRQLSNIAFSTSGGHLYLDIAQIAATKTVWTGASDAMWNFSGTNWKTASGGTALAFADGDSITFDSVSDAADKRDITIGGRVTVSDMFVQGAGNYRFSGASITGAKGTEIAGATGGLYKEGAGTLTLANSDSNYFEGGVHLGGGMLVLESNGALGDSNLSVTAAGTKVKVTAASLLSGGTITLNHGSEFEVQAGSSAILDGVVTGPGILAKTGAGLLALNGNNTSGIMLGAGTLALGHERAISGGLSIGGAGTVVRLDISSTFVGNVNGTAGTVTFDTHGHNATLAGVISGGDVYKIGSGTLALAGINTYSGTLGIREGTVVANSMGALGAAGSRIFIGADAMLGISEVSGNLLFDRALTGRGRLAVSLSNGSSIFEFGAAAGNAFEGTLAIEKGSFILGNASSAVLSAATLEIGEDGFVEKTSGDFSIGALSLDGGTLKIAMNGGTVDGMLTVQELNTGTQTSRIMIDMAGVTGTSQINPAIPPALNIFDQDNGVGELKLLSITGSVTGDRFFQVVGLDGNPIGGPTTYDITQANASGVQEKVADAHYNYIASIQSDGIYAGKGLEQITILEGKTLLLDNSTAIDTTLSAALAGSGGVDIRASGTAGIVISGNNTYSGPTTISGGITMAGRANVFESSESVTIREGARFDTGSYVQTARNLSGSGTIVLGGGGLVIQSERDTTYSGEFGGAGGFAKEGSGTLTLGGPGKHSGANSINAGRVIVRHPAALGTGITTLAAPGSGVVLEINGVQGTIAAGVNGVGVVEIINSNITFGHTSNRMASLTIKNSVVTTPNSVNSLGHTTSNLYVDARSVLRLGTSAAMRLGNGIFEGGSALLVGADARTGGLAATGTLTFGDGSRVGLARWVPSGSEISISAAGGIVGTPVCAPIQFTMDVTMQTTGTSITLFAVSPAVDPTRAVSMAFDSTAASLVAINGRMTDALFRPLEEPAPKKKPKGFWVKGVMSTADYETDSYQIGHGETVYGIVMGYDVMFDKKYIIGAYFATTENRIESTDASKADTEQRFVGGYTGFRMGRVYAGIEFGAGQTKTQSERNEHYGYAFGDYDGYFLAASLDLGVLLGKWKNGHISGFGSMHYMGIALDDFTETGIGAVSIRDYKQDLLQSLLGFQATQQFKLPWGWQSAVDLKAAWRQNVSGNSSTYDLAFVGDSESDRWRKEHSRGYAPGGNLFGLGLRSRVSRLSEIGLEYTYEVATSLSRHTFVASVRWDW